MSSLLGRMSHAARAGLWVAPLYYRALQRQQALLLHRFGWRYHCLNTPWGTWDGGCPQLRTIATVRTSLLFLSTFPSGPMHPYWDGVQPAMARRPRNAGAWRRQNNTSIAWNSKAAILALKAFLGAPTPTSYPSGNGQYNRRGLCEQERGTQSPSLSLLALELWSFLQTRGSWVTAVIYREC